MARSAIFQLDAEKAHNLTLKALKAGLFKVKPFAHAALSQELWGIKFPNPVGLAAGFDKNADVPGAILKMGFGFTEVGTVTPKAQDGNPKPRVFRDPPREAVINRMGFPNQGMNVFKENLSQFLLQKPRPVGVVGINIGMNKTQSEPKKDYTLLIRELGPYADYMTVNISSPNTPGLRNLQEPEHLAPLIESLVETRNKSCGDNPPPLLVKLAPDLEEADQESIAKTLVDANIDGIILTNTTLSRPEFLPEKFRAQTGGLSGAPLTRKSTAIVKAFYQITGGKIPLIGIGGIGCAQDAYDKICAGASLVQLYSALVFQGPELVGQINTGLLDLLKQDGHAHLKDAIGSKA